MGTSKEEGTRNKSEAGAAAVKKRREKSRTSTERGKEGERERRVRREEVKRGVSSKGMDHKTRMALAEALSSGGVNARRVALEVLYLLPEEFVRVYEDLFHRALSTGEEGRGGKADAAGEVGKSKGLGKGSGGHSRGVFMVRDVEALATKDWADRQLRKLARQIKAGSGMKGGGTGRKRCRGKDTREDTLGKKVKVEAGKGCGKWLENGWGFCPFCGAKVQS